MNKRDDLVAEALSDTVPAAPICEFVFSELLTGCTSWVITLKHSVKI